MVAAVATYYLRSLSQAVSAPPGASKAQKYRFLGNYFKDLPEDLDALLLSLRHMVQELEAIVAKAGSEGSGEGRKATRAAALAMCDEIRAKAALPEAMFQVSEVAPVPSPCGLKQWLLVCRSCLQTISTCRGSSRNR